MDYSDSDLCYITGRRNRERSDGVLHGMTDGWALRDRTAAATSSPVRPPPITPPRRRTARCRRPLNGYFTDARREFALPPDLDLVSAVCMSRPYIQRDSRGRLYCTPTPGTLGGHCHQRSYGRLDWQSAARVIARGHYVRHRVFFADEATAFAGGYRPCAVCLPVRYSGWKQQVHR